MIERDRTQYLADKIQNCSKGCLKLEVDRTVCRAIFTSKRGALKKQQQVNGKEACQGTFVVIVQGFTR